MTISGVSPKLTPVVQNVLDIRTQLDDLQRQIGTGQKADSFAGLGPQSGMAVGLAAQLSAISAYTDAMTTVGTRISIGQADLTQLASVASTVKATTLSPNFSIDATGQTTTQKTAQNELDQMLSLLNTQAGDRYLFSGSATNQPAVDSTDHILNGNGAQAGLRQIIAERNQADLGVNGLGRLVIPSTAAKLVGSGAALGPDLAAVGTGTVNTLTPATTLVAGLGFTAGDILHISDGTHTVNYVVGATDTVAQLTAGLSGGSVNASVSLSGSPGHLVVTAPNNAEQVTLTASAGGDLTAVGFAPGNQTFAPTNAAVAGLAGTLTLTIGANATTTLTFGGTTKSLFDINNQLASLAGGTASVDANGNLSIAATSPADLITVGGTANPLAFGLASTSASPGSTVSVSEDVAGSPFGFKLSTVNSTLTGTTVTGPSGSPAGISVAFGATQPNNGDTITFAVKLPDGSTEQLALQATTKSPPGANQFTIGASAAATAANFQTALTTAVGTLAHTSLSAASSMAAADNFFATDATHPPLRVAGPPFGSATALVAGTPANTVSWYTGENGTAPPRSTATARIDSTITMSYGMRANEQGIRWLIQSVAVLAATTYQQSDPNAPGSYAALNQRVDTALAVPPGTQKIDDIEASLASAQTAMQSAGDRQKQTQNTLTNMLQQIEGIDQTQVGTEILALQTSLQASLQITAKLSQISLVNYLPVG
jgi:flagellar hook-associated protein 3 FlgL